MAKIVYACDIGSVRSNTFAWARNSTEGAMPAASGDIDELIASIIQDFKTGSSVALGFEAPQFIPVPLASERLNVGRPGEGNRSLFAPAGAAVTTISIQETAWILSRLGQFIPRVRFTMDWRSDWASTQSLMVWEAFVSGSAHSASHERDAATAVQYFLNNIEDLGAVNAVSGCEGPFSLIGAAALWSGWGHHLEILREPCLVLRPDEPYPGEIAQV